jgi:hypothetical protein
VIARPAPEARSPDLVLRIRNSVCGSRACSGGSVRLRFSLWSPSPAGFAGILLATTVLFFGLGIFGFIVTLGSDDSIAGRIISGAVTVSLFYFGVQRLRLLRVD